MSPEQLTQLAETKEVLVETTGEGRSVRTIIWVVVVDGQVYIRTAHGDQSKWYLRATSNPNVALVVDGATIPFRAVSAADQETIERVSLAFEDKYLPSRSVGFMIQPSVLHTTLRLEPT